MSARKDQFALLRKMGTPTRLGQTIGLDYMGAEYVIYKWLIEVEKIILNALNDKKQRFIILNLPPQTGKTTLAMLTMAWYLGMNPSKQVIFIAYSEEYASSWGLKVRNLMDRYGRELFGEAISNDTTSKSNWKMSNGFGGMLSVGIGGGITGNPGDLVWCVTGETIVETSEGPMRIDDLVDRRGYDGLDVQSFRHESDQPVLSPITAAKRSRRAGIVEVTTESGRSFRCTDDHLVFVEGLGYRQAQLLQPGWRLRCMSGVRNADLQETVRECETLQAVLDGGASFEGGVPVPQLRQGDDGDPGGPSQTAMAVLRQSLHDGIDEGRVGEGGGASLPLRADSVQGASVLLARVPNEVGDDPSAARQQAMPALWSDVSSRAGREQERPLLARMRQRGSLRADAGEGQFPLQDRGELHLRLQADATCDSGDRRPRVRGLRDGVSTATSGTPHRPQPAEQHREEPDNALRHAPCNPPQVHGDAVSLVRRVDGEADVYDITVPECGNFFANGILVHNCDDILKTMEEAASPTAKQKHLDEYDGAIATRLQSDSTVIITATRFAEDDLSGALLERQNQPGYTGDRFEVISVPAIAEPPEDLDLTDKELEQWRDFLGRRNGEPLESRHDPDSFARRRDSLPAFVWSALYQQSPSVREGGMFPRSQWVYWSQNAPPICTRTVRVWDLATTEGGGDWTVGSKFGLGADGHLYLLERERARLGTGKVEELVKRIAKRDGYMTKILIEQEKAGAGVAVVENYQRILRGYTVEKAKIEGSKEQRATPYSSMQNNQMVHLPVDDPQLCKEWIDEHKRMMGDGRRPRHDDQIDTGAYATLDLIMQGSTEMWIPGEDAGSEALQDGLMRQLMGQSIFEIH